MGWLFGKKKVESKVPFPAATFQFESRGPERVFEPQAVQRAVGLGRLPEELVPTVPLPPSAAPQPGPRTATQMPLFLHTENYRTILGELDALHDALGNLQSNHAHLQSSEYNEEHHFTKLRRAVRGMHDRLLQVDKILFKG